MAIYPFLISVFFLCSSSLVYPNDDDEILHAKRISDLWNSKEREIVEKQINLFLTKYPNSNYRENFFAILGDCNYEKKDYFQAIQLYRLVSSQELRNFIFPRLIDSLNKYGDAKTIITEIKPYLENVDKISTEQEKIYTYHYAHALLKHATELPAGEFQEEYLDEAGYRLSLLYDECKNKNVDQALYFLNLIIKNCKSITYFDYILYKHHCILYTLGEWKKAREEFQSFLKSYPNHIHRDKILKRILISTEKQILVKRNSKEDLNELYSQWIEDLIQIENNNPNQFKDHFKKFEAYSYLKQYEEAIHSLETFIAQNKENNKKALANYLIAKNYHDFLKNYEKFIFHAEKAIELDKEFKRDLTLQLHLFHAYFSLYNSNNSLDNEVFLKSIEHLKTAYELDENSINDEIKQWYFHYLLQKIDLSHKYTFKVFDQSENEDAAMAIKIFHQIYTQPTDKELFILSKLYAGMGDFKRSLSLLEDLIVNSKSNYSENAQLLLGQIHEFNKNYDQSTSIYQLMTQSNSQQFQYIGKLCHWSLELKLAQNFDENNEFLKELKKLEMRRTFNTEPLHLEAGLHYAFYNSLISSEKDKKLLENLIKLKKNFLIQEGIVFKDYHIQREQNKEKDVVFNHYIHFIDAYISLLESKKIEDLKEKEVQMSKTKKLFLELKKSNLQNTLFLPKWIDEALKVYNESFQNQ